MSDIKKLVIGFLIGLLIGVVYSSIAFATPSKIKGNLKISNERILEIEKCVKKHLKFPSFINMKYEIRTSLAYEWRGHDGQVLGEASNRGHLIKFDGKDETVLAHEIAHVYGADEDKAQETEWYCG